MDKSGLTGQQLADALTRALGRPFDKTIISKMKGSRGIQDDEMAVLRTLAKEDEPRTVVPIDSYRMTDTTDSVPLFGYANAAGDVLRLDEDHIVRTVPIHPAQVGNRNAFAAYVFGDSMEAKLEDGDIVFAIRNAPPVKGQLCIIELKTGESMVKLFDRMDDQTVFARQLNPARNLTFSRRDVQAVYRVVGSQYGG